MNNIITQDLPSEKAKRFIDDLVALCIEHKVQLCAYGYDNSVEIWDADPLTGPIQFSRIEDCTKSTNA